MSADGYVKIHRRLLGHPAFRNDAEAMAFAWMVAKASWRPVTVRYKEHIIALERGDLTISIRDIATALDRPKGWVERLISRLKSETMIRTRRATGGRTAPLIVSICNYSAFQAMDNASETRNGTRDRTPRGTATGQRPDREQEHEEEKKEEKKEVLARAARLRADFSIPDEWMRWAISEANRPEQWVRREFERFRDYWVAKSGKDAAKADWLATWRNWIRKAVDSNGSYRGSGQPINPMIPI